MNSLQRYKDSFLQQINLEEEKKFMIISFNIPELNSKDLLYRELSQYVDTINLDSNPVITYTLPIILGSELQNSNINNKEYYIYTNKKFTLCKNYKLINSYINIYELWDFIYRYKVKNLYINILNFKKLDKILSIDSLHQNYFKLGKNRKLDYLKNILNKLIKKRYISSDFTSKVINFLISSNIKLFKHRTLCINSFLFLYNLYYYIIKSSNNDCIKQLLKTSPYFLYINQSYNTIINNKFDINIEIKDVSR